MRRMSKGFGKTERFILNLLVKNMPGGLTVAELTQAWLDTTPAATGSRRRSYQEAIRCAVKSLARKGYVRLQDKKAFSLPQFPTKTQLKIEQLESEIQNRQTEIKRLRALRR
jgi:hypothetical protein